jgi:hypothetical protein
MIERFKQLRTAFSEFDKYGNVETMLVYGASHKPLENWLHSFNTNLYWILPIVKNIKKVYDVNNIEDENNDILNLNLSVDLREMNQLLEKYK